MTKEMRKPTLLFFSEMRVECGHLMETDLLFSISRLIWRQWCKSRAIVSGNIFVSTFFKRQPKNHTFHFSEVKVCFWSLPISDTLTSDTWHKSASDLTNMAENYESTTKTHCLQFRRNERIFVSRVHAATFTVSFNYLS